MTVNDLRVLVENLDEYIHTPDGIDRLKKTILHLAVSGQLVPQDPSEGTGEELFAKIQAEKARLIREGKLKKAKPLPEITEAEIPFEIPKTWKWVRLGDVLELKYGKGIEKQHRDKSYQYSFYGANGELDKVDQYLVKQNGIIVGRKGSAGAVTLVDGPFWPSDVTYYVEENQFGAFDRLFLFYLLLSLDLSSLANGIKPGLNRNEVYELRVILFPHLTQERLAKKIRELYELIDELAEKCRAEQAERRKLVVSSLAQLSHGKGDLALKHLSEIIRAKADAAELRKTILHLAISGQLVPQDPTEGTGEELYQQIQVEKIKHFSESTSHRQKPLPEILTSEIPFDIPSTWKWVRLNDVGKIVGGGTPSSSDDSYYMDDHDTGIAWLTPADLRDYADIYISHGKRSLTKKGLQNSSAQLMPKGTILFSSRAPIGHVAIAENDISTNQGFKSVVPYDGLVPEYIYRWLQFYGPVIDAGASGTTFREVSGAIVAQQLIPLPPQLEQSRIVQKTKIILDVIKRLEVLLPKAERNAMS